MKISTLCSNSKYLIDMDSVISSLENSYTVYCESLTLFCCSLLFLISLSRWAPIEKYALARPQVVSHKNTRIDTHPEKDHKKYYHNAYKQRRELKEIPFIGHWIIFRVILLLSCYARRGHLWNAGLSYQRKLQ